MCLSTRLPQVIPLTERAEGGARNVTLEGAGNWSHVLRDLSPGATYQLHAFTLLHDKESAAYASFNFTTSECTAALPSASYTPRVTLDNQI